MSCVFLLYCCSVSPSVNLIAAFKMFESGRSLLESHRLPGKNPLVHPDGSVNSHSPSPFVLIGYLFSGI